jgi:repressor LexA
VYGEKLRELRKIEGWTQEEVAKRIGVSKQTYSHYENEKRKPSLDTIKELAAVYSVKLDDIFTENENNNEVYQVSPTTELPIVGRISCGNGIIAYEDIEGYEPTPQTWLNGGKYFYLRAKGNSMTGARINDGDLLLIRQQEDVEDGEIAAVYVDGEAKLKRVFKRDGNLILQSENTKYPPQIIKHGDVKIIGKLKKLVVAF